MTGLVLDNSIVLSWRPADEEDALANRAMKLTIGHGAVVPGIWWYELRNALGGQRTARPYRREWCSGDTRRGVAGVHGECAESGGGGHQRARRGGLMTGRPRMAMPDT